MNIDDQKNSKNKCVVGFVWYIMKVRAGGKKTYIPQEDPRSKGVGKSSSGRQLHLMATEPGGVSFTVSPGPVEEVTVTPHKW